MNSDSEPEEGQGQGLAEPQEEPEHAHRERRLPRNQALPNQARARAAELIRLANAREELNQLDHSSSSSSSESSVEEGNNAMDVNQVDVLNLRDNIESEASSYMEDESEREESEGEIEDGGSEMGNEGSGSDDSSEEENDGPAGDPGDLDLFLLESLRAWAQRGVSGRKVDQLLRILKVVHPFLPLTCKTLLQTPSASNIRDVGSGMLWYKGIMANVPSRVDIQYMGKFNEVVIDVNIDGIPLFKSNSAHFFPILGCLQQQDQPFIIAVWYGPDKDPGDDLDAFFEDFTEEVQNLQVEGCRLFNNIYPFRIRRYILDALARSYVKCIKQHNARNSCEKCEVLGYRFRNRMVYVDLDAPLRTDESFRNRAQADHHIPGLISPLENLGTGMVSQFALDPLHLVYLGAFKRWLMFLLNVEGPFQLDDEDLFGINEALSEVKELTPVEFNRKPRPLMRTKNHFKGHELRRLVIYDGLRVFQNLDQNLYNNYLLLHSALYILSSAHLRDLIPVARDLLRQFIQHARRIFTRAFVSYNVHSLAHLADECEENGVLDSFSAFKYENFLGVMKNVLRSGYLPLTQIVNRDGETNGHLTNPTNNINPDEVVLSRQHVRLGVELVEGTQYQMLQTGLITLKLNDRDACFVTPDSDFVILSNIVRSADGEIFLIGRKFGTKESAYDFPMNSTLLGIFKVSNLENERRMWNFDNLSRKCYLLPCGEAYLAVPLYSVLKFTEEDVVEVVPSIWLKSDTECYWPPKSLKKKISLLVIDRAHYDTETWSLEPIEFLHDYNSFYHARAAAKKLEDNDAISTEHSDNGAHRKRKIKKPSRFNESEEETSAPAAKKIKKPTKRTKLSSDSDLDSDKIPAPNVDVDQLESRVNKIIAERSLVVKKSDNKFSMNNFLKPSTSSSKLSDLPVESRSTSSAKLNVSQSKTFPISSHSKNLSVDCSAAHSKPSDLMKTRSTSAAKLDVSQSKTFFISSHSKNLSVDSSAPHSKPSVLPKTRPTSSSTVPTGSLESAQENPNQPLSLVSRPVGTSSTPLVPCMEESSGESGAISSNSSNEGSSSEFLNEFHQNYDEGVTTFIQPQGILPNSSGYTVDVENNNISFASHEPSVPKTRSKKTQTQDITGSEMNSSVSQIILEKLEGVLAREKTILANQRRILSYIVPENEQDAPDFEELPSFPLSTVEEFNELEEFLAIRVNRKNFVEYLFGLPKGDMDEKKAAGKMLTEIISNRLSRVISWGSTGGTKIKFEGSRCNSAMRCAVLKLFPKSKLTRYEKKVQTWFNTSFQRKV